MIYHHIEFHGVKLNGANVDHTSDIRTVSMFTSLEVQSVNMKGFQLQDVNVVSRKLVS